MVTQVVSIPSSAQVESGAGRWFRAAFKAIVRAHQRRLAKAELRALPDHLLSDMGLSRYEIDDYVDGKMVKPARNAASRLEA